MAKHSGFEVLEHRIRQITNSFSESRNVLAEIEDNLHASGQLRRGESDKISEVDSELLRCGSSIQGGWERIIRFRGKAQIPEDDPIIYALEKTFSIVENKIYRVLTDAHTNEGFLDYSSIIVTGQHASQPLVDALKDLMRRLRELTGIRSPNDVTPPVSGGDRPRTRSRSRSGALRVAKDHGAAIRHDDAGTTPAFYDPQARKGLSLVTGNPNSQAHNANSYRADLDMLDDQRFRDHESFATRSRNDTSEEGTLEWTGSKYDRVAKHRPPPLFATRPRNQSTGAQPRVVSSIQEELPDLELGPLTLSPDQFLPRHNLDSRNNSTSDDGGHQSQVYGSSWKSSTILTPDTMPSPISPGPPPYNHSDVVYSSNVGKARQEPLRSLARETKWERADQHDASQAISPHGQPRKKKTHPTSDNFGPPPGPPPSGRLPEPPRPKMSLFPPATRRDLNRELPPKPTTSPIEDEKIEIVTALPIMIPRPASRQQPHGGSPFGSTPPDHTLPLMGTHGLKFNFPPTSVPAQDRGRKFATPTGSGPTSGRDVNVTLSSPTVQPLDINRFNGSPPPAEFLSSSSKLNQRPAPTSNPLPIPTNRLENKPLVAKSVLQEPLSWKPQPQSVILPQASAVTRKDLNKLNTAIAPDVVEAPSTIANDATPLSAINSANLSLKEPRPSIAVTTSSEGTITQEKWLCLTRTVKQIPGLAGPPVDLVPSTSASTRPVDNLPNESNKFWTLCKNAVVMQTGDTKKSPEEVANRPIGVTGNEKYMKCRKCKYEYSAYAKTLTGKGAVTDPRWKEGPNGIMYRETILFKSHVTTKKDKLPQEEYRFGCIFCAANGNGMPIYKGKTSFLTHLGEHGNGAYPNEVLKTRIKFTTKREFDPINQDDYYELVLP